MTIAFDSSVESPGVAVTDPQNVALTVPAGCRGVEVYVGHIGSSDQIVGMTLGGVALTRIASIANTSGSPGRAYKYGLGTGVLTGARTLAIDRAVGSTSLFHVVVAYLAGAVDCEVVDFQTTQGFLQDPSVLLAYGGRTCLGLVGMQSSINTILATTADFAGQQRVQDHAFGATDTSLYSRQTTPGNVDFTMGYTMNSGQVALIGTAWSEVVDEPTTTPPPQPGGPGGEHPSPPELLEKLLRGIKTLADLCRVLAKELGLLARNVVTYEEVAILPYATVVRPSGALHRHFYVTVSNNTPFTIADPERPREGAVITLDIRNNSGGAMGAVTFGDTYALQGAFTAPANAKHRLITFYRSPDGKWREMSRSANDLN